MKNHQSESSMFDKLPQSRLHRMIEEGITKPTTVNISPIIWELGKKRGINMSELCRIVTQHIIIKDEAKAKDLDVLFLRNRRVDIVNAISTLKDRIEGLELELEAHDGRIESAAEGLKLANIEALYMEYVDIIRRNLRDFNCDTDFVWEVTQDIRMEMKRETGRTITRDSLDILATRVKRLIIREESGFKGGRFAEPR